MFFKDYMKYNNFYNLFFIKKGKALIFMIKKNIIK